MAGKMSQPSPSLSEDGEIVSADEEKAYITKTNNRKDGTVNKSTRLPGGSSSRIAHIESGANDRSRLQSRSRSPYHPRTDRSRSPHRSNEPRSRSPYRASRPRSRSPYRANKVRPGEKRQHDDDHYTAKPGSDPRRFKVHYEHEQSRRGKPNVSHALDVNGRRPDLRRGHPQYDELSANSSGHHRGQGRERDRSRSPFRHSKVDRSREPHERKPGHPGSASLTGGAEQQGGHAHTQTTDHSRRVPSSAVSASQRKKGNFEGPSPSSQGSDSITADGQLNQWVSRHVCRTPFTDHLLYSESVHSGAESAKQLTEVERIEERRKRREAIKARHKPAPPLLVQALQSNVTSAPNTPINDHDSSGGPSDMLSRKSAVPHHLASAHHHLAAPSSIDSPGATPQQYSPVGSPAAFSVSNDEELLNHHHVNGVANDDGPSAADYDPNMDMQEDRPDHIKQDVAPAAEGVKVSIPPTTTLKPAGDPDMFAEDDDDDDMFAPGDKANKVATTTKQAKALDQSLLDNWDYPDGHYRIIIGELLDNRYAVQQQIGKGTFATVVRAQDTKTGNTVAVKIACNNETMYKAGTKEMDFLDLLNAADPDDKRHIIRLLRNFDHKGHMCLVFEHLSADLREVLKKFGRNVGLNLKAIRSYAQQMFQALNHMKKNEILHADLKPDNILVSEKRNLLKICDLGTAAKVADAEITPYLVSRFYRAPEVILGMPFDYAIDMWSIGCTLFELHTGRILFAGSDNNQMLRAIQECRGKFPIRMLKKSSLADRHFDTEANFVSQERDKLSGKVTLRPLNLSKTLPGKDLRARLMANSKDLSQPDLKELQAFVDLMEKCLQLDPARRITPSDALRHHFIMHASPVEKAEGRTAPAMAPPRVR